MNTAVTALRPKMRHPQKVEPIVLAQAAHVPPRFRADTTEELFKAVIKREFLRGGAFVVMPGVVRTECQERGTIETKARCIADFLQCRDVSPVGQAMIKRFIERRSVTPLKALRQFLSYSEHRGLRIAMHTTQAGHVVLRWQRA